MTDLKGLMREMKKGSRLIVTHEHAAWRQMTEAERFELMTERHDEIMEALERILFGHAKVNRGGRIGASGLGGCLRASLFGYAAAPSIGEDPDSVDLMSMGTQDHLWWQIEGITMGWLSQAESYVGYNPTTGEGLGDFGHIGGSLDGFGDEVGTFELKTLRESKYTKIVQVNQQPEHEHLIQWDFYAEAMGLAEGSIVYQERGGGSFHEFRVRPIAAIRDEKHARIDALEKHIANDTLPPMLPDCEQRVGKTYLNCGFRKYCPKATGVIVRP